MVIADDALEAVIRTVFAEAPENAVLAIRVPKAERHEVTPVTPWEREL